MSVARERESSGLPASGNRRHSVALIQEEEVSALIQSIIDRWEQSDRRPVPPWGGPRRPFLESLHLSARVLRYFAAGCILSPASMIPRDIRIQVADWIEGVTDGRLSPGDGFNPVSSEVFGMNYDSILRSVTWDDPINGVDSAAANAIYLSTNPSAEPAYQSRLLAGAAAPGWGFDASWRTSDVVLLASGIFNDRAFDRMPYLADALQDAGCTNDDWLPLLRNRNWPWSRGCRILEDILSNQ